MSRAIGLDFGTTNSALAIAQSDRKTEVAQFNGSPTFRSILYFEADQTSRLGQLRIVAGPQAIESYLAAKEPGRLIQSTKSYLASRLFQRTQILNESYTLEELIGILLRHLRLAAEQQLGDLGSSLVVGRPVHFSGSKIAEDDEFAVSRLKTAFTAAGFDDVQFLPEPVAAAYKYQRTLDHDELVLIADFGGGTSDFSLVHLQGKPNSDRFMEQVVGNDGVGMAGDSFDSRLVRQLVAPMLGLGSKYRTEFGKVLPVPNWLYEHLERWHYLSFLKTRKNMELLKQLHYQALEPEKLHGLIELVDEDLGYRLYQAVEAAKCALSRADQTGFRFAELDYPIEQEITRKGFETWITPELSAISQCVDRLLDDSGVNVRDVDAVFMTGGSSFVPAVRRIFETKFSHASVRAGQEFTSVAEGLALHALERVR